MALRASYISYMNGFQVCLMVPTTILAEQHYETLQRFSEYDVDVVLLTKIYPQERCLLKDLGSA